MAGDQLAPALCHAGAAGGRWGWSMGSGHQQLGPASLQALQLNDEFQVVCPSQSNRWLNKPEPRRDGSGLAWGGNELVTL